METAVSQPTDSGTLLIITPEQARQLHQALSGVLAAARGESVLAAGDQQTVEGLCRMLGKLRRRG